VFENGMLRRILVRRRMKWQEGREEKAVRIVVGTPNKKSVGRPRQGRTKILC
jgi:hypothetical protein